MFSVTSIFEFTHGSFGVRFDRFVSNKAWSEYGSACNDLVSASNSDSAAIISTEIFVNGCNNRGITVVHIRRITSNTVPSHEEQRAVNEIF